MSIVRTPLNYPLRTITREESSDYNAFFISFLERLGIYKKYVKEPDIDLPEQFNGALFWKKLLSPVKNQGNCGGCYAFAAASALSDRYNIMSNGKLYVNLSAIRIILCDLLGREAETISNLEKERQINIRATGTFGCSGNTLLEAWRYLYTVGTNTVQCVPEVLDEKKTCIDYVGPYYDTCVAQNKPAEFFRAKYVYAIPGVERDGGSEYTIRKNIFKYGPVTTAMDIYENFYTFDPKTTIYSEQKGAKISGHAIVIDGWGVERGIPFWWVRNSWGEQWGLNGYFKLLRGFNFCKCEENVIVGAPDIQESQRYYINMFEEPEMSNLRKAIISTFNPHGGIDSESNISRRYMSYESELAVGKKVYKHSLSLTIIIILLINVILLFFI
jgi:cathepsin B